MSTLKLEQPTYFAFPIEEYKDYLFGVEKISAIRSQLQKNAELHWEETETLYRQDMGDPNYNAYIQLEAEGKFVIFTVRHKESRDLVGHMAFYVYESMHNIGIMEAREDAFFIAKDHRGGRVASKLYDYVEKSFISMGVHQISMSSKAPAGGPDIDKFLKRKGFKPVAIGYFKPLIEENSNGDV